MGLRSGTKISLVYKDLSTALRHSRSGQLRKGQFRSLKKLRLRLLRSGQFQDYFEFKLSEPRLEDLNGLNFNRPDLNRLSDVIPIWPRDIWYARGRNRRQFCTIPVVKRFFEVFIVISSMYSTQMSRCINVSCPVKKVLVETSYHRKALEPKMPP